MCRLKKAIYGLCQAARQFYIRLDEILTKIGYSRLAADWAIWIRASDGAFIAVHVDDMAAVAPDSATLDEIATLFSQYMELKDLGEIREYLAISVHQQTLENGNHVFLLSQAKYIIKLLAEYGMDTAFEVTAPVLDSDKSQWHKDDSPLLNSKAQKDYQALIGSLLYLMHATRPDIAYGVIRLSQYATCPRKRHWQALKRILRYLKGTMFACLTLGDIAREGTISHMNL